MQRLLSGSLEGVFFKLKTNEFIRVNFIRTEKIYFQHVFCGANFKAKQKSRILIETEIEEKKKIFHTFSTTVLTPYTDTGIDRHQHSFDSNAISCIYSSGSPKI